MVAYQIDLYNFKSHVDLGSPHGHGSSSWGWTSDDDREFVAIGQTDGAAFAEITEDGELVYLGRLPHNSVPSLWREIRGLQIFDMKKVNASLIFC
jgi:hypothetical protein